VSTVVPFPVDRISDEAIIRGLKPFVERAIRENPGADASAVAGAAMNLIGPEDRDPLVVWWCARASLRKIAIEECAVEPSERDRRNIRRDEAIGIHLVRPVLGRMLDLGGAEL
jgi:hypothetical protein